MLSTPREGDRSELRGTGYPVLTAHHTVHSVRPIFKRELGRRACFRLNLNLAYPECAVHSPRLSGCVYAYALSLERSRGAACGGMPYRIPNTEYRMPYTSTSTSTSGHTIQFKLLSSCRARGAGVTRVTRGICICICVVPGTLDEDGRECRVRGGRNIIKMQGARD